MHLHDCDNINSCVLKGVVYDRRNTAFLSAENDVSNGGRYCASVP